MRMREAVVWAVVLTAAYAMSGEASGFAQGGVGRAGRSELSVPRNPCVFPTVPAATPEETAWQLFVAANCPANRNQLVWETWIEQLELFPGSGTVAPGAAERKRLHGSPLAHAAIAKETGRTPELVPAEDCNVMRAPPPNVVKGATICEEVRLNRVTQTYVTSKGYQIRAGQTAAAKAGTKIQFPSGAVQVKVNWIPATAFNPPFSCTTPPPGVRVQMIDGTCYAMAGMHISSKLMPNWIWATFEPQSLTTNPNRCIAFGSCNDSWGSSPAISNGGAAGFTAQTPALRELMTRARLAPEFNNYRLDGVQTTFGTAANPTLLGNSVIEGANVGMKKGTASCITCHSVSSVKDDGTDGIRLIADQVGPWFVPPAGWIARDFVWSVALACPGGIKKCQ